ncbi:MAG: DUF3718 domain-containing protein [Alkalimonas sp.]|uniref:DUF3718 domain-containing protein n=1 Tax=Alkalimonas delamerensis TaxID=265981 RepID=A0ABT9GMR0_9GAMM|nr:DUF3718 domain-containing protein [Alkalimonas delamerensis]MCC5853013.1 DUF3718 domain-containing protein [Alkalimonas sp.]MDP4527951.1 DUF3718 domain-containing protein [Alkalimonas delamerensis]
MKLKFVALASVLAATAMFSSQAQADQQLAVSICSFVAADSRNDLRKTLSDHRLRLRNVYDGIVCDGLPLVRHAIRHNANDTADFIIRQLPGSQVAASGDIEWAESNGFGSSPVIESIRSRANS